MKTTRVATLLGLAFVVAGCARVEGRTAWEDAIHTQPPATRKAPADAVYPVPPPPFSAGVFPCSRCHEGGEPVKDDLPAIPHKLHVGRGIECADCHMTEDAENVPKIPERAVCDTCHGDPAKLSKGAAAYFAKVTDAAGKTNFPHRWTTRDIPSPHERHLKAGIACTECHGEVSDAPFEKPKAVTFMQRCVSCHERKQQHTTCDTCHRDTRQAPHANVVLHHSPEHRCFDCHDEKDRDRLHLSNGAALSFDESFKLCGQCHGTQYRDWKIGLHGKRTGEWNGRREYRLCVSCHWPHEPRFAPMQPMPRPARPEEIK